MMYGFGQAAEGMKNETFSVFLLPFYSLLLGLDPLLTGVAMGIAVIFDAVTDPLAGWFSDHLHSPWKRRHPFMYGSILPLGVSYYFLWHPPQAFITEVQDGAMVALPGLFGWLWALPALFWWLLAFTVLVRASMTLYHVPHLALTAELTEDYDARTRLTGLRVLFSGAGVGFAAWAAWRWYLPDTADGDMGRLDPSAYGDYALFVAVAMGAIILISGIGTHSEIPKLHEPPPTSEEHGVTHLFRDMFHVLRKRSVLSLVLAALFAILAIRLTSSMSVAMYTYFWELSSDQIFTFILVLIPSGIIAHLVALKSSEVLGKKYAFLYMGIAFCIISPMLVTFRLLGWLPDNGTDLLFNLMLLFVFTGAVLGITITILQNSMMADITDEYELEEGHRREGLFFSLSSLVGKAGGSLGIMLAGYILSFIALPAGAKPGEVPAESLFWLGLFEGPLTTVIQLFAILSILLYGLTRARHNEIIKLLAERRSEAEKSQ